MKMIDLSKLDVTAQQNTLNEMRILSSIDHRFLVGYKEAFQSKIGEVCLVMEYIGGGDL